MRLIDADNLENFVYEEWFGTEWMIYDWIREVEFDEETLEEIEDKLKKLCWKVLDGCMNVIKTEPIAYDVDKVLEQIENKMFSAEVYNDDMDGVQIDNLLCMGDVYEIVKAGERNDCRKEFIRCNRPL